MIYFHGVPGAPEELALFGSAACSSHCWAPDRNTDRLDLGFSDYFDDLANRAAARASSGGGVHLVGFSLGAVAALQVACRLGTQVARIDLISAAAPLELGEFLPGMAGKSVFTTAKRTPGLFGVLTSAQAVLARHSPVLLVRMLLQSAQGEDRGLARDPAFRKALACVFRRALSSGGAGYRREVLGYVQPWSSILSTIAAPVRLWHGTADNWSPIAMADCIQGRVSGHCDVVRLPGLAHYSTLRTALGEMLIPR